MNRSDQPGTTKPVPSNLSPEIEGILQKVDRYRATWEEYIASFRPEDLEDRQARLIRKHAIETGILERLYDVSWGVTQSLVADGITSDVYERAVERTNETVNDTALETIKVQLDALQMMVDFVNSERDFTPGFIRELHAAMTRNQQFVESKDQFGRSVQMPLHHGEWKLSNNEVERPNGEIWTFVEPMQVQSEIEYLITEYKRMAETTHPIVLAAWLHYSFINIHPFTDGNGRVARALTLFALLRGHYPPIVVSREARTSYINALDEGNNGDLNPLIKFFAKLEESTLLGELNSGPLEAPTTSNISDLAKAFANKFNAKAEASLEQKRFKAAELANELQFKIRGFLETVSKQVAEQLQLPALEFDSWIDSAAPPEPKSKYYSGQIISAARTVGFFSNHAEGTWWTCLTIRLNGKKMKFVVVVQKVGHGESGVLAVTVSGEEYFAVTETDKEERNFDDLLKISSDDWVNMTTDTKVENVWPEVNQFIDKMAFAAIAEFFNRAY